MKNNFKNAFLALAIGSALTFGCSKKNDETPADKTAPILVSNNLRTSYALDGTMSFELNFTDETELSEAKVSIHSGADGHTHGGGRLEGGAFSFEKIYKLSGKNFVVKDENKLASDLLTGDYHFIVNFTDKAGNAGEEFEYDFELTGKTQPAVAIQYPGAGVTLTPTFTPSGGVTAVNGLKEINMYIHPVTASGEPLKAIISKKLTIADKPTSVGLATLKEVMIPTTIAKGDYLFIITAIDVLGNSKSQKVKVKI